MTNLERLADILTKSFNTISKEERNTETNKLIGNDASTARTTAALFKKEIPKLSYNFTTEGHTRGFTKNILEAAKADGINVVDLKNGNFSLSISKIP